MVAFLIRRLRDGLVTTFSFLALSALPSLLKTCSKTGPQLTSPRWQTGFVVGLEACTSKIFKPRCCCRCCCSMICRALGHEVSALAESRPSSRPARTGVADRIVLGSRWRCPVGVNDFCHPVGRQLHGTNELASAWATLPRRHVHGANPDLSASNLSSNPSSESRGERDGVPR